MMNTGTRNRVHRHGVVVWPRLVRSRTSISCGIALVQSVQNRDARAVDYSSEQRVMVMMVGSTPVPARGAGTHAHAHPVSIGG